MEVEALLVILLFSLVATTLLFAYMFHTLSKSFKDSIGEAKTLIQTLAALYEYEREKNQKE